MCVFIVLSSLWTHSPHESHSKIFNKIHRETRVPECLYNKDDFDNLSIMWILRNFSDIVFPEHLLAITLVRKFKGSSWESIRSRFFLLVRWNIVFVLSISLRSCGIINGVCSQLVFTCSKSTMETPEQCVKSVQS